MIKKTIIGVLILLAMPIFVSAESEMEDIFIENLTETVSEIRSETKIIESEMQSLVKKAISDFILDARSKSDIESYELRNAINASEAEIYKDIRQTITKKAIMDMEVVDEMETNIEESLTGIGETIEEESNTEIDISKNVRSIKDTLLTYRQEIKKNNKIIAERGIDLIEVDTDGDGLSDYDEKHIFNTNPENAYTVEGELNDAEKIIAGIDPTSKTGKKIKYNDPRQDKTAAISDIYQVNRVELIDAVTGKALTVYGRGIPNSYITLYIYSTPVIVTVRTDHRGEWSYTFDKELENGEHDIYVATVNNSGKLLARSDAIAFTKTAEAATLGTFGIGEDYKSETNFVQENFILVVLVILLIAILVTLLFIGNDRKKGSALAGINSNVLPDGDDADDKNDKNPNVQ